MPMPTPRERLSHLLELAAQGASERAALGGEVADLLLDWPAQYPAAMRGTFEALLEKIVREMDGAARAALAPRFASRDDFALPLMNEFFLHAPDAMQDTILARNDAAGVAEGDAVDGEDLLGAARLAPKAFAPVLAQMTGIPAGLADAIIADARALAALAKGAGINRATFSAIAILAGPVRSVHENFQMLSLYDRVPENGARHLLAFWRTHGDAEPLTPRTASRAAE